MTYNTEYGIFCWLLVRGPENQLGKQQSTTGAVETNESSGRARGTISISKKSIAVKERRLNKYPHSSRRNGKSTQREGSAARPTTANSVPATAWSSVPLRAGRADTYHNFTCSLSASIADTLPTSDAVLVTPKPSSSCNVAISLLRQSRLAWLVSPRLVAPRGSLAYHVPHIPYPTSLGEHLCKSIEPPRWGSQLALH